MLNGRSSLDFELTFMRGGGANEQSAHAHMFVLGYLEQDKPENLRLAADKKLTTKSKGDKRLVLDVLVDEEIFARLGADVAKRSELDVVMNSRSNRVFHGSRNDYPVPQTSQLLFSIQTVGRARSCAALHRLDCRNFYVRTCGQNQSMPTICRFSMNWNQSSRRRRRDHLRSPRTCFSDFRSIQYLLTVCE